MIAKILAIVAAAVSAGAIVMLIPEPAPAVAAGPLSTVQSGGTGISDRNKSVVAAAVRIAESRNAACTQGWPYYEVGLPARQPTVRRQGARCAPRQRRPFGFRSYLASATLAAREQIDACCIRVFQGDHYNRRPHLCGRRFSHGADSPQWRQRPAYSSGLCRSDQQERSIAICREIATACK